MATNGNGKKKETQIFLLPEGRLINHALFEKDVYVNPRGKEGKPLYKVEIALEPDSVTGQDTFEDALINAACDEWGDTAEDLFLDGTIKTCFKSGDKMAAAREAGGKGGDAYKGKLVLRANTQYNKHGQDAPGGIAVFAPDKSDISIANAQEIYPGCYVQIAVSINPYIDDDGDKRLSCYLCAVQKTRDGEKLITQRDLSTLFKPVGRTAGAAAEGGRRSRKG